MVNDMLKICCVVSWEGVPFDLEISRTCHADDLKDLVHSNRQYPVRFIDAPDLLLYKLETSVPVHPPETLLERLPCPSQWQPEAEMNPIRLIKHYFSAQPPSGCIHVIVHTYRSRLQYHWISLLFERYWGRNDLRNDIFSQASMVVPCYESDESQTRAGTTNIDYTVLNLGPDFKGFISDDSHILITQEYKDTLRYLEGQERRATGVILTGRPGIGKVTFLHYVLVERVLAAKPTAFQRQSSLEEPYLMITGDRGVSYVSRWGPFGAHPETWALVDSDASGSPPHPTIYKKHAPLFTVQATAPESERWTNWRCCRYPRLTAMRAWTWDEIYIAHCIRKHPFDPDRLRTSFVKFGGSIAVCFALSALENPNAVDLYEKKLLCALDSRLIYAVKAAALEEPSSEPDMSFSIVSIEPGSDRSPKTCVVSRHMENLIYESLLRKEEVNSLRTFRCLEQSVYHKPLRHAIDRIWKRLSLATFTGTSHYASPFRAEPLFSDIPSIGISVPMRIIKYPHDRLGETLVNNGSSLSCPNLCFQPVGSTRATFDLLQVTSSGLRVYWIPSRFNFPIDINVGELDDILDGLVDAAREDACVSAWFKALSPDGGWGTPFKCIFVLSEKPERYWSSRIVSVDAGEEQLERWNKCSEIYVLVPTIGEV